MRVRGHGAGFTLVELMIVTALAAIVLSLAIPSYRNIMMRVHRADAIRLLNEAALCQQRRRMVTGHYDTRSCGNSTASRHYHLSFTPTDKAATDHFVAAAVAIGSQAGDVCGTYILASDGNRSVDGDGADPVRCWGGR
jgi:type IV pilus assembly protein PilE